MSGFNYTFLLSLSIIAIGFLLKKIKVLTAEHGKSLSRVIINVTLPALILKTITGIELDFSLFMAPLICIVFSLGVSLLSGIIFAKEMDSEKGIARMSSVGFNIGLFAYPIINGLFGSAGLSTVAMLDVGNAFIVFGLSYFLGFYYSTKRNGRTLGASGIIKLFATSIPFMSYIIAIIMNVTGLSFPGFAADFLDILAKANNGMALIVLGLTLEFRFDSSHWKLIAKVIGLRYVSGLVVGILLYMFLPFSLLYRTVILFGLLLPVGMAVIPYSVEFDYDARITGTIANFTMIISFIFMWLFMLIFGAV